MTFNARSIALEVARAVSLQGKQAIVTGAASGIGVETTRALATAGANVVLAVRDVKAGEVVAQTMRATLPPTAGTLEVEALDLADLKSVDAFVARWLEKGRPLHLLINNAGVMATPEGNTAQGFELQLGTNHIGHFALTSALLPTLEKSAPSRVISVSSDLHKSGDPTRLLKKIDQQPVKYARWQAYGDSKLANVLFIRALAKRLPPGVEAFSVHPGVIPTRLSRHMGVGAFIFNTFGMVFMKSPAQGAATSVYGATSPELATHSGAYLQDVALGQSSKAGQDEALAETVWEKTRAAVENALQRRP